MYAQNLNPGAKHVRHKLKGPKLERDPKVEDPPKPRHQTNNNKRRKKEVEEKAKKIQSIAPIKKPWH